MEFGIITALLVVTIYILLVALLWKTGTLDRLHIGAIGPMLMFKTRRGVDALTRLARFGRFWYWFGNVSLGLVLFFMALLTVVLLWEVPFALQVPASSAPGPEMILGLPGINPLIPLGYGVVALIIAIFIHEFAHGVLTRVADVKVKSVGMLLFVVPIGAFVEPDEKELLALPRRKRARMYATGPASNIMMALACAAVFSWGFMGSVQPVEDGVVVTSVVKDYPAGGAGLKPWTLLTEITIPNGTGLDPRVRNRDDFTAIMDRTSAGDNITISYIYKGQRRTGTAVLADKYEYYQKYYNASNKEEYRGKGFLGIGTMSADVLSTTLARPIRTDSFQGFVGSVAYYIGLPFFRLLPLESPVTELYTVEGPLAGLPAPAFWMLANTFYWLFWLNLMVGATNSLPIPKLDGGMVFKDGMESLLRRLRPMWTMDLVEKRATTIYRLTGLFVVFLIAWQFIGPRVGALI
jgi:membrane-associated protease RseP (regulator of RpoE activity)